MKLDKAKLLVEQFEKGSLPKEQWTHSAHFIIALWYCVNHPLPKAVQQIREGIKKYNVSSGGQNTSSSGYHETITLFYITTVAQYLITAGVTSLTDENIEQFLQQPFLEKNYPLKYYSKDRLMSREARLSWLLPGKSDLNA